MRTCPSRTGGFRLRTRGSGGSPSASAGARRSASTSGGPRDRLARAPEATPALATALPAPGGGPDEDWRDAWSGALEQALPAALTREDVAALDLERALAAAGPAGEAEDRARARVRAALGRCT